GGVVPELVLCFYHRLGAKYRTGRRVARLGGKGQLAHGGWTHGDGDRSRARQAGTGEVDRDVGRHVVRQVGERDDTCNRGEAGRALQRAAARVASGCDDGAVVIGAQVAELILNLNDRLLRKGHSGGGGR